MDSLPCLEDACMELSLEVEFAHRGGSWSLLFIACCDVEEYFRSGSFGRCRFFIVYGATKSEANWSVFSELILLRDYCFGSSICPREILLVIENLRSDSTEPPSCFIDPLLVVLLLVSNSAALASSADLKSEFLLFLALSRSIRRFFSLSSNCLAYADDGAFGFRAAAWPASAAGSF